MNCGSNNTLSVSADVEKGAKSMIGNTNFTNIYEIECYGPDGTLKWKEIVYNTVVNEGLDDVLEVYFKAGTGVAHYVGLTDGTPTVDPTDTMSSHVGWTEVVAYDEAVRQTLTLGSVSSQSVDNSASKATFTISADSTTVGGIFIAESATKSESASVLYGGGAFTGGDKSVDDDDVLNVTVTLTTSSS